MSERIADKDLLDIFRFSPSVSEETRNILASYSVVIPPHEHQWRKRKLYLDVKGSAFGAVERRCFYSWKVKTRRYSCYATYVYVEKLGVWNYCMSGEVTVVKKFPGWYEAEESP